MALQLDTRTALVERLPALSHTNIQALGRKHVHQRQRFLTELLTLSYERRRPHAEDRTADSFSRDFLVKGLKVAPRGDAYGSLLRPFYDFPEGNQGYSKDRKLTKPYRLKREAHDALHAVYAGDEAIPVVWREDGSPCTVLPESGLPAGVSQFARLAPLVPLEVARVDHAIKRVSGWIEEHGGTRPLDDAKPNKTDLGEALRLLYACRQWARSLGGIPNFYRLQSHGRLGPDGFHLISLPSRVRHPLFEGSGLVDYDITSCHWSIFKSLGRALGFATEGVEMYLDHKWRWHSRWAGITGVPQCRRDDFKAVASSWLTGGTLSSSERTESVKRVGARAMAILAEDEPTQWLYREVRAGLERIKDSAPRCETESGKRGYVNAVGAVFHPEGKQGENGRIYSHLLTGYEQFAIREMCSRADGLQAIVYDGFIARPQPVEPLEKHLREKSMEALGFPIEITLKVTNLSEPLPDPKGEF